jgi:hypothetical protein
MPFVTMPGVKGKVYVPEKTCRIPRKYPCPDCFSCQFCSDGRCSVCRDTGTDSEDRTRRRFRRWPRNEYRSCRSSNQLLSEEKSLS